MLKNKKQKKVICFTGGGTAGHIMPNISIISLLDPSVWDVFYIGSKKIEENIVVSKNIKFKKISSGKLRRYFSIANFVDFFKVVWGFLQCIGIFTFKRPSIVFSKGGFVSVPVCFAAFFLRIPVITHESDLTPGLATKLISRVASKVLYTFPESAKYFPKDKAVLVGSLVRPELFRGSKKKGLEFLNIKNKDKKILLVMGGSLGSEQINQLILSNLKELTEMYTVVHITGKEPLAFPEREDYHPLRFVKDELADLFACVDLVVSRAGANAIFEFLALKIPMLLIPLRAGSRGDQVDNALNFLANGYAKVLEDIEISDAVFLRALQDLDSNFDVFKKTMSEQKSMGKYRFDRIQSLLNELT